MKNHRIEMFDLTICKEEIDGAMGDGTRGRGRGRGRRREGYALLCIAWGMNDKDITMVNTIG